MRAFDWDPIRAEHYGQRLHRRTKQAGHMTAPDQCCSNSESSCQGGAVHTCQGGAVPHREDVAARGLASNGEGALRKRLWPQGDGVSWAAAIGDTPDRAVSVLADEESAVTRHGHADGAGPNRGVIHDETGHEVLIFAGRNAVLQVYADHFVAGPFRAVPRPVLGRERIPTVFRGELVAIVDDHSHRGRMRLDQHVGYGDLVL